jgi:hypothetical protein
MNRISFLATVAAVGLMAGPAFAGPINDPPPAGSVIYSLTGQTPSSTYQEASVSFSAISTSTNLAFAFREDPAFIELSDVSLVDTTTSSGNLVLNGNFNLGPVGANQPLDWTYLNTFGASFAGVVGSGCGVGGSNCYDDGAVQAYDGINQVIATTIGDDYTLTFDYLDTSSGGIYQPVSTNGDVTDTGGNGRDMFVYAGVAPPTRTAVPEPASLALFSAGLFGFGVLRRRRKA